MSYLTDQKKGYTMYVALHVPSKSWHPGHSTLKLYHAPYEIYDDYPDNGGWIPHPVIVKDAPKRKN